MKITALAPWFGSKRTLAPRVVEALGPHRVYWEPFCGSMAVLLAKESCVMETVNDLHGELINLARVLKSEETAVELYGRVARFVFHEGLFEEARERYLSGSDRCPVDRAEDYMIVSWFGRNGVAGPASNNGGFCVRYTANGGHAATRWKSAVASIPDWHHRLRNVTILQRDGIEIIDKIGDDDGAAIYCDPPYLVKGAKYVHDFAISDHDRLAEALRRFTKARVVVSYYDHPRLAELYPGWTKIDCTMTKSLVSQGQRGKTGEKIEAPEVLLVNDEDAPLFA